MTDYLLCVLICLFALGIHYWTSRVEDVATPQQVPVILIISLLAGGVPYGLLRAGVWLVDIVLT